MFPNVTNVEGMFYFASCGNGNSSQEISSTCFSNCKNCDNLFNSAQITLPAQLDFSQATSMRFAFASGTPGGLAGLTTINLGSKLNDMTGMFSARNKTDRNNNVLNNKATLLSMKRGIYTGMLYGYDESEDTITEEYKYISPSSDRQITNWNF